MKYDEMDKSSFYVVSLRKKQQQWPKDIPNFISNIWLKHMLLSLCLLVCSRHLLWSFWNLLKLRK